MGYSTKFYGRFDLDRPLTPEQSAYLTRFSHTRRMGRIQVMLADRPDPERHAVGLPLGDEGEYFVGGEDRDAYLLPEEPDDFSVLDDSEPPPSQPGLWCDWVPTVGGWGIEWNGAEKFYGPEAWLYYLIQHFLRPWGYRLNGLVKLRGDDPDDRGSIEVVDNRLLDYDAPS